MKFRLKREPLAPFRRHTEVSRPGKLTQADRTGISRASITVLQAINSLAGEPILTQPVYAESQVKLYQKTVV